MRRFKKDLVFRYSKIIPLIIFIFFNSIAFGAVSSFVDSFEVGVNDSGNGQSQPTGVQFNPDGTRMYVSGISGNWILQYSLDTPFDVSSVNSDLAGQICNFGSSIAQDGANFEFNSDGTKIFMADRADETIEQFKLTTAYDISTCVHEDEIDLGITTLADLAFSRDGMKLFIYDQNVGAGAQYTVEQFSLTSPYNLTNATLVATYTGPSGSIRTNIQQFAQAMVFNIDGTKMYITGGKATSTATHGGVYEFTLSSPFDVNGAITYEGEFDVSAQVGQIAGLTFSANGSKMYITDFTHGGSEPGDRGVYEYSLTCSFGVIKCIDPSKNKDDVATMQSQTQSVKKLIKHSTSPVLNRMQWLRRNENKANLTNQNIKFKFNNEILNSLSKTLIPVFFSNDASSNLNSQNSNWSIWSEGTISIGKSGDTTYSSAKDISTTAITFGADKRDENNIMRGIALRLGNDDVDVGDLGSALDMSTISLTLYGTDPKGDNKFADTLIGISILNSDIVNSDGSNTTTSERNGIQIYGSYNFRNTYNYNLLNYTPKIKFDLGGTHLEGYSEKGSDILTYRFQDQFIGHLMTTVGTSLDKNFEFNDKSFVPYLDLNYTADISPSSSQKFTHISTGEKFILENINNTSHNFNAGIGLDLITDKGLNLMSKYTIDQSKEENKRNFVISADYRASYNSSYALSINETSTEIAYKSKHNNLNFDVTSNLDFFADDPEYGIYLKVYTLK